MTWFITLRDIILFVIIGTGAWFWLSLTLAVWINKRLGLSGDDLISWLVALLSLGAIGTPIFLVGKAVLT